MYNNDISWGEAIQSNFIQMMENFAHTSPPVSPMDGQLWFDTTAGPINGPVLNLYSNAAWYGVVAEGLPVQGHINMNNFKIAAIADPDTSASYVASSTGWGLNGQEAMNLRTSDLLYIAKTGGYSGTAAVRSGTMTGSLFMTGSAGINFYQGGSGNLTFEASTSGGIDIVGTGNITVAAGNIVATAGNMRVGSGTNQVVTQNNAGAAPTITFTTATTNNVVVDLDTNRLTGLADPVNPSDAVPFLYADNRYVNVTGDTMTGFLTLHADPTSALHATTKQYVDMFVSGIIWLTPVFDPTVFDDSLSSPPVDDGFTMYHKTFIVAGTGAGDWTGFDGHLMAFDGTTWQSVLGRPVTIGDRFGVFCEPDDDDPLSTLPGGSFTGNAGKLATVLTVSPYTYSFYTPAEPDAFSVKGIFGNPTAYQSPHMGHSYTFRGTYGSGSFGSGYQWIEFSGPQMITDGAGIIYAGNTLNVGAGTGIVVNADDVALAVGNVLSLHNLSTNGIVARTAANTVTARTITGTTSNIDVVNGDGVSANPTINLATVTQGTTGTSFVKIALDTFGRVTDNTSVIASDITSLVDGTYVNTSGDTMTGALVLNADPVVALEAATKQYVDVSRVMALAGSVNGTIPASAKILMAITAQAFDIESTPATNPCYGYADVVATGATSFDIQKNGVSVGSMAFAPGVNTATFTFASPVAFAIGDRIAVVAPVTPDATLADVYFTIRGTLA